MKKSTIFVLIAVLLVFSAFVAGFYLGRNTGSGDIRIDTSETGFSQSTADGNQVNINTATVEELTTLPGVGQVLAQRIIAYRTLHGDFRSTADLANVDGIGKKTLQEILPYITIGG